MNRQLLELANILERAMKQRSRFDVVHAAHGYNPEAQQIEKAVREAVDKCRRLIDELLDYWNLPMNGEPPF